MTIQYYLDPRFFILYTAELADIAVKWNLNLHSYADDTQVLLHCQPDAVSSGGVLLKQCIDEIGQGTAANSLKLNADKTALIWTGKCSQLKKLTPKHFSLTVGSCTVKSADSARLLGVLTSPYLTLTQHISSICASCFY